VDVLTLTATPIPRTLHMSLTGVRDMSTIDTPPAERLAITGITGTNGKSTTAFLVESILTAAGRKSALVVEPEENPQDVLTR
jgi:transcription-repair coupling factor (superfamily II helicase)